MLRCTLVTLLLFVFLVSMHVQLEQAVLDVCARSGSYTVLGR
jgi:hypothetical protein